MQTSAVSTNRPPLQDYTPIPLLRCGKQVQICATRQRGSAIVLHLDLVEVLRDEEIENCLAAARLQSSPPPRGARPLREPRAVQKKLLNLLLSERTTEGKLFRRAQELRLERAHLPLFPLSWTLMPWTLMPWTLMHVRRARSVCQCHTEATAGPTTVK
jgi:hypothetical protein